MSSKLIARERAGAAQPMPWVEVGSPVSSAGQTVQYAPDAGRPPADEAALIKRFDARLAALEAQAERRAQEAREAGRREGETAGRNAAQAELQPVFQKLAAAIQNAADLRPKLRAQAEGDLVKLAISIARRIVNRELATDPDAIAGLVRVGLEKIRVQELIRIRMHPDHLPAIRSALAKLGADQVELAADPVLERGGVTFETSRGILDASVETQFREIDRGLTDRLGAGQ
jgi:flagellar assembly protein FliH